MSQIPYKPWKVTIVESDSFRGQEILDTKYYDNEHEARAVAREINHKNSSRAVPDCYIFADVSAC